MSASESKIINSGEIIKGIRDIVPKSGTYSISNICVSEIKLMYIIEVFISLNESIIDPNTYLNQHKMELIQAALYAIDANDDINNHIALLEKIRLDTAYVSRTQNEVKIIFVYM